MLPRPLKRTSLSPPRPMEMTRTASTIGFHSPMRTPSLPSSGWPPLTTAMSVVVPPMSAMIAFRRPLSAQAPTTLAARPDNAGVDAEPEVCIRH
jgi:hypothetical protein